MRTARRSGSTVVVSLGRCVTAGKKYLIWSPEPFLIAIRLAGSSTPVPQSLSPPIVRTAVKDGHTVVLAMSKFLRRGDVCHISKDGDLIQIQNMTQKEKVAERRIRNQSMEA